MRGVLSSRRLVGGLAGAAVVAVLAIAASLAGGQGNAARDARVFGPIRVKHCTPSGSCRPGSRPDGKISVRMAGRVVATHPYHKGRYSLHLVPGRYTLVATLGSAPGRSETKTVHARAHRSTRVDFVFVFHQR